MISLEKKLSRVSLSVMCLVHLSQPLNNLNMRSLVSPLHVLSFRWAPQGEDGFCVQGVLTSHLSAPGPYFTRLHLESWGELLLLFLCIFTGWFSDTETHIWIFVVSQAIDAAIREFSEHPKLEETDSAVVVIMSHGKLGAVLGVNWKKETSGDEKPDEFPSNNIYKHLGPEECKALTDKPKIIIIQACRGGDAHV